MTQHAIRIDGLWKEYVIGNRSAGGVTFREALVESVVGPLRRLSSRRVRDEARFWALKDISLEIAPGEVVGIIGRNGAGKSTLLKILSRITAPTRGSVEIWGRIASLLEVGTGFHPELTGRENIRLNGAILGMSVTETARKFDEIVAFAEVERFLDVPVKRYSSGMYLRLAFAVAAHLEPEILIVDEVLAVGDAEFQKKCLGKMSEVAGGGRTVLFVSHNLTAVQTLCSRCIWINAGSVAANGAPDIVISEYLGSKYKAPKNLSKVQEGLSLERCEFQPSSIRSGEGVDINIVFRAEGSGEIRECAILLYSDRGVRLAIIDMREATAMPFSYGRGAVTFRASIEALPLIEGAYTAGLFLVTDGYAGDLLELADLTVSAAKQSFAFVPYPSDARGLVRLAAYSTVSVGGALKVAANCSD